MQGVLLVGRLFEPHSGLADSLTHKKRSHLGHSSQVCSSHSMLTSEHHKCPPVRKVLTLWLSVYQDVDPWEAPKFFGVVLLVRATYAPCRPKRVSRPMLLTFVWFLMKLDILSHLSVTFSRLDIQNTAICDSISPCYHAEIMAFTNWL